MHLASQPLLTLSSRVRAAVAEVIHLTAAFFRRRNSRTQRRTWIEARVAHTQRQKNISARELIQHQSADTMHHFTQRDVVDIAVNEARSRRSSQRFAIKM